MFHRVSAVLIVALISLVVASFASSSAVPSGELTWLTDFTKATADAKKSKKLILADFTGSDWCGWCQKLKAEVFDTKEFADWAAKNVVLLELDFPKTKELDEATKKQNEKLKKEHKITGYPTIIFMDSTGKAVGKTGYVKGGPAEWIKAAEKAMKKK
jgi:thioredoxin-related protein